MRPTLEWVVCHGTRGHPEEDRLVGYLRDVPVCFGPRLGQPAPMSMVWVENCALGHILAAVSPAAGGCAFYLEDFAENIVAIYRRLAGRPPPRLCLPVALLVGVVRTAVAAHCLVAAATGRALLGDPMMGPHDGAITSGRHATVSSERARRVLGYASLVTRDAAVESCRRPAAPLLPAEKVRDAVAACRR